MSDDFAIAAIRHYLDGELLADDHRLPNADQLFGFAAECAIKSALVHLAAFTKDGKLQETYRTHVNILWDRVHLHLVMRRHPGLHKVLREHRGVFSDWCTDQRYAGDGAVTAEVVRQHRQVARRVLVSVGLNGVRAER